MLALLAALLFLVAAITGEAGNDFLTLAPGTWLALGLVALAVQIALADAYVARRVNRRTPQ
jgi:hypothetical protein